MRKLIVLAAAVVCFAVVFAAPKERDQCGAKVVQQYSYQRKGSVDMDLECEMCLDLVLIGETYAECDEAKVEHEMEKKCDKDYKGPADKACRNMVDKLADEIIKDTEKNPTNVCYKVIHRNCTYSAI